MALSSRPTGIATPATYSVLQWDSSWVMIFDMTSLVRACLTLWVKSYQSDVCRFRPMTLSPLHLAVNWPGQFLYLYLLFYYQNIMSNVYTCLLDFSNFERLSGHCGDMTIFIFLNNGRALSYIWTIKNFQALIVFRVDLRVIQPNFVATDWMFA